MDLDRLLSGPEPVRDELVRKARDDEVRQRALEGGAIAILDKPFDDQSLLDAVELAMGRNRSS